MHAAPGSGRPGEGARAAGGGASTGSIDSLREVEQLLGASDRRPKATAWKGMGGESAQCRPGRWAWR